MATRSTPTTRMRELGERLRALRIKAGLTVEGAAKALLVSASKISRLETGARRPSTRDVRDLCQLYGVDDVERERLMALAAQAQETSWYQSGDHSPGFRTYIGLEQAASRILGFEPLIVPGLLQTPEYARHLVQGLYPPGTLTAERVEDVVASRTRRQETLHTESPVHLHAILDEAVLRRTVGGQDVMTQQRRHLATIADLPNVILQIVPFGAGAYSGLMGPFTVLQFSERTQRDAVFSESLSGAVMLDRESVVLDHVHVFEYVARTVALDATESRKLLRRH